MNENQRFPRSARRRSLAVCLTVSVVAAAIAALPTGATPSRDHRPILFERQIGPAPQIAAVDPGGQDLRTLTDFKAGAREAQWAPGGGRIVFSHVFRGRPGTLFTMRAGGERLTQVSHGCRGKCLEDFEPAWSSDGGEIVFDRAFGPVVDDNADRIDLMLVNRNGTDVRVLKSFANSKFEPHGADFSPDDRRLAFTLVDVSTPDYESAIFILDFATDEMDRVTPWRLNAGNADWSANGRRILFNSNYLAAGTSDLFTIAPGGSGLRRLTNYPGNRSAFAPTWSPSNRRVAFTVASAGVPPHAVVMKVGGEDKHRITPLSRPGVVLDWG